MGVVRAFIAIDLPPEIDERLGQVSAQLEATLDGLPLRWVYVGNVHLTLKFLGDVSEASVERVTEILTAEASNQEPLEVSVGGLGVYPSMRRPRVIWVGVEASEDLHGLQRRIEAETSRLGYAPETREFSPHLTLGRVARSASAKEVRKIGELLGKEKLGFLGAARVEKIHLFKSDLQPGGAVYSKLFSTAFGG